VLRLQPSHARTLGQRLSLIRPYCTRTVLWSHERPSRAGRRLTRCARSTPAPRRAARVPGPRRAARSPRRRCRPSRQRRRAATGQLGSGEHSDGGAALTAAGGAAAVSMAGGDEGGGDGGGDGVAVARVAATEVSMAAAATARVWAVARAGDGAGDGGDGCGAVAAWVTGGGTTAAAARRSRPARRRPVAAAARGRLPQSCASACDQGARVSTCACDVVRRVRAVARTLRAGSSIARRPPSTATPRNSEQCGHSSGAVLRRGRSSARHSRSSAGPPTSTAPEQCSDPTSTAPLRIRALLDFGPALLPPAPQHCGSVPEQCWGDGGALLGSQAEQCCARGGAVRANPRQCSPSSADWHLVVHWHLIAGPFLSLFLGI
jgi:hypothetical protein